MTFLSNQICTSICCALVTITCASKTREPCPNRSVKLYDGSKSVFLSAFNRCKSNNNCQFGPSWRTAQSSFFAPLTAHNGQKIHNWICPSPFAETLHPVVPPRRRPRPSLVSRNYVILTCRKWNNERREFTFASLYVFAMWFGSWWVWWIFHQVITTVVFWLGDGSGMTGGGRLPLRR